MPENNYLKQLNEMQLKAIHHPDGPLLIAAGAGSGKTRTLTSKLIHLIGSGIKPEEIIALTFTNKAAKEMRNRVTNNFKLSTNNLFIGTFHSLGAKILKEEAGYFKRTENYTIFDAEDSLSLIKNILKEMNLPKEKFNPIAITSKISGIKNEMLNAGDFGNGNFEKITRSVFEKYESALEKSNAFDFDDLIEKVVRALKEKPEVLKKYQNRWKYILVDEFQDVNTSQYVFVKLLAQESRNLFVIGDDAQSIYAFRGSDFRNFLNFEKDWNGASIIKLEENYRSSANIISAASRLITFNKNQKPKNLWTKNPEGSLVKIFAFNNPEEEAYGVAEKIKEALREGEDIHDIAIVYRTNAQSRALEQALIRNQIPYEIFGGLKFYSRKEIKDVVSALRYAFNPQDAASIERINKNFLKNQRLALLETLPTLAKELTIVELINFIIEKTDYLGYLDKSFNNANERADNIKELIYFASQFNSPTEFLQQVSLMSSLDGRPKLNERAIKIMTIHLAKGLEFNRIFIVGAMDGLLPHERSINKNEDLEEERRLMYVAMTRAKKDLNISFYGLPSRFLGELPPELIEFKKITDFGEQNRDLDDEYIYIDE